MEADLFAPWLGRCNQLLDHFEDGGKLLVVFLLEDFDFAGEIAVWVP
jgi:hypothetical protein